MAGGDGDGKNPFEHLDSGRQRATPWMRRDPDPPLSELKLETARIRALTAPKEAEDGRR